MTDEIERPREKECEGVRERERERQTERQTDRQTDRQSDRDAETERATEGRSTIIASIKGYSLSLYNCYSH